MKARTLILILSLECVLQTCSHAFVLRKRSAWDDNDLSKALQVVERERLRLGQSQGRPDDWERLDDREREGFLGNLLNGESQFTEEYNTPGYLQDVPSEPYADDDDVVYDALRSEKRTKTTSPVDLEELQDIFGPSKSDKMAVNAANVKRGDSPREIKDGDTYDPDYKKRLYDPSEDDPQDYDKKNVPGGEEDSAHDLSSAEVSKLLDEVESVEKGVISDESPSTERTGQGQTEVSKDEIEDVLKDDVDDVDKEENNDGEDTEPEVIEAKPKTVVKTKPNGITVTKTEEKEWPSVPAKAVSVTEESVMFQPSKQKKNKRSKQKRSGRQAPVQDISDVSSKEKTAAEIARQYLKVFLQLEDDENSNLANALNIATLSQIKRTDKHIPEEIRYLRKAILDEEMIQKLDDLTKSQLGEPSSAVVEEGSFVGKKSGGDQVIGEVPLIRKREDPGDMPPRALIPKIPSNIDREELQNLYRKYLEDSRKDSGQWFDGPISEEYEGASNEDSEEHTMNPFLRELMKAYEESKSEKQWEKRAGEYSDEAVPRMDDDPVDNQGSEMVSSASPDSSASEEEVTNALAAYVDELSSSERRELTAAVEDKLAAETCPAVRKLSDNCLFMDQLKMTVDDEARNLCNRHQMCYSCGAVGGRSRADCDAGYLEEAKTLCEQEQSTEKCKEEAKGLFLFMSKMHEFVPVAEADDTCASPCVMSYVLGSSSD